MTDYETLGAEIGRLVSEKNQAYGDAYIKTTAMLKILYPDGIPVEKMDVVLPIARVLDKLCGLATDNDPFGESPWIDIAGYGIRAAEQANKTSETRAVSR